MADLGVAGKMGSLRLLGSQSTVRYYTPKSPRPIFLFGELARPDGLAPVDYAEFECHLGFHLTYSARLDERSITAAINGGNGGPSFWIGIWGPVPYFPRGQSVSGGLAEALAGRVIHL